MFDESSDDRVSTSPMRWLVSDIFLTELNFTVIRDIRESCQKILPRLMGNGSKSGASFTIKG